LPGDGLLVEDVGRRQMAVGIAESLGDRETQFILGKRMPSPLTDHGLRTRSTALAVADIIYGCDRRTSGTSKQLRGTTRRT
jgi:hypothetical protein